MFNSTQIQLKFIDNVAASRLDYIKKHIEMKKKQNTKYMLLCHVTVGRYGVF